MRVVGLLLLVAVLSTTLAGAVWRPAASEAAAQGDEWTHAESTCERSAANEMTETAARPGRCTKQDPEISAGRHDTLR